MRLEEYYSTEEMVGKSVVLLLIGNQGNCGVMSEGMMLAADDGRRCKISHH